MTEATLAILYNQRVGAVDRIFSLLRRRDYPVGGITLERTHRPEIGQDDGSRHALRNRRPDDQASEQAAGCRRGRRRR